MHYYRGWLYAALVCLFFLVGCGGSTGVTTTPTTGGTVSIPVCTSSPIAGKTPTPTSTSGVGSTRPPPAQAYPLPNCTPSAPVGVPAIQPTQNGIPAFTMNDVRAYLKVNGVPRTLNVTTNSTVVIIQFITSAAASSLLDGESIGVPDQEMVCYVELSGSFVFPGLYNTAATFPNAVEIFDAQTGNLLLSGGLSEG